MRAFLVFAAIIALPVLVLAHRVYFLEKLQPKLVAEALAALNDPAFAGVEKRAMKIDYLDVSLDGWVADPALREEAGRRVAAVRGLRCSEQDNHLYVPAHLSSHLDGEKIMLSGWLHDGDLLQAITRWLQQARPGLEVDVADVRLSPHVSRMEAPPVDHFNEVPAALRAIWDSIRVPAALEIRREQGALAVSGALPSISLRDAVNGLLRQAGGGAPVRGVLRGGAFVKMTAFADEEKLPNLLQSFFASPGAESFEAHGESVTLRGFATPADFAAWEKMAGELAESEPPTLDLRLFASPLLFPNHARQSELPQEMVASLQEAFQAAAFRFESGELNVTPVQSEKLNNLVPVIVAAGPAAHIVVGVHLDTEDDAEVNEAAAKGRIESVTGALVKNGVPREQIEGAVLPACPAPDGSDQGRMVELILK